MPTREELHTLVDTLPEPAVEVVHRLLSRLQVWPPPPPPQRNAASGVQVRSADGKPVMSRFERWEGDTFIHETMRNHGGHELKLVERIRVDGQRLIYKGALSKPELLRAEMKRARSVVTVTEYNRRHLRQIDPSLNGKVRCIDCIFDFSGFDFQWPRVSGLAAPLILSVARLVEKKGLEDLILLDWNTRNGSPLM